MLKNEYSKCLLLIAPLGRKKVGKERREGRKATVTENANLQKALKDSQKQVAL